MPRHQHTQLDRKTTDHSGDRSIALALKDRFKVLIRLMAATTLGVLLLTAVVAAPPTAGAAGLSVRRLCANFLSADGLRKLSVCARGWTDASGAYARGVVEMHAYRYAWGVPGGWIDAPAQSITLNAALMASSPAPIWFGNDEVNACRRNSPSGTVSCSTPGAARVAYYSPLKRRYGSDRLEVFIVSWRDDRGIPRTFDMTNSNDLPLEYEF